MIKTKDMKTFYHTIIGTLAVAALLACGQEEAEPVKYKAPEVNFTMGSDDVYAKVGETVSFSAQVVSGDKVSIGWYIDDVLTSGSQRFDFVFDAPGDYSVRFEARNGAGTVSHTYTAHISDLLSIRLSVGDSTKVTRLQLEYLKVAAIVEHGSDVLHEWSVDGKVLGDEAYFGSFRMDEARDYEVHYRGANTLGVYEHSFTVTAMERPLEVSFSVVDDIIAILAGRTLSITATALFGGTGLQHRWYLDDELVSETVEFSHYFVTGGEFQLRYEGENAKGEKVSRTWKVTVTATGRLFDDFEAATLGSWFNLGENQPGIERVENPDKSGINTSDWVLRDKVYGTGGTSGYFTMKGPKMLSDAEFDISNYSGIRFMVYLGNNKYYPRIDYGGVKYPSVAPPKFNGGWEVLEYRLPEGATFDSSKNIVFRMLLNEAGSNISGGGDADPTNNRTVYIDNIEFFK